MTQDSITIYTIGHGRHAWADFLALLQKYEIAFLCDVRSVARSRWVQFNGAVLAGNLLENGIGYEWLPETGGKFKPIPEDLNRGVERILEIASEVKTAIMCSEVCNSSCLIKFNWILFFIFFPKVYSWQSVLIRSHRINTVAFGKSQCLYDFQKRARNL